MARQLVIIHGYSDSYRSFRNLARLIADDRGIAVKVIALGDYVTLSDYVTFADIVAALDKAWDDYGLPRTPFSVDAIVHSTGGLVIRDWLSGAFAPDASPVKNLVMLAPANFGSPLAHKGRSFIGRVVKGFGSSEGPLQSGTQVLKGLELASPYSWNLAQRDRFGDWARAYGAGGVLCTVLVGNRGYDGIKAIANEDGGDGTVRVSTANLNCARLTADFVDDPLEPNVTGPDFAGGTAFLVADGHNHDTVTFDGSDLSQPRDRDLFALLKRALEIDDAGFDAWCDECVQATGDAMTANAGSTATQGFQNTVVRLEDHQGNPITDYLVEFYEEDDDRDLIARLFHTTALADVHPYSDNASFRSLYVNCTKLSEMIDQMTEDLRVSVTAHPIVSVDAPAGFRTFKDGDIGAIRIRRQDLGSVFAMNRTMLITLRIRRERDDRVFRFVPGDKKP